MKKKGFTLIELLAVIVILAIIALIATPLVLKYIETARTNSKITSTQNYMNAVENALAGYAMDNKGKNYPSGCYEISTLNKDLDISVKGDIPSEGKICIENNKIEKAMVKYEDNKIVKYENEKATLSDETTYESFSSVSNYIIDADVEFTYDESQNAYAAILTITKDIADKFEEAIDYDLIIDNGEVETIAGVTFGSNLIFQSSVDDASKIKVLQIIENQITIMSMEEVVGVKNVKIGNPRTPRVRFAFKINEDFISMSGYDFVEGLANIVIKNEDNTEYYNNSIELIENHGDGIIGIDSTCRENIPALPAVYTDLINGKTITIEVRQVIDGKEIVSSASGNLNSMVFAEDSYFSTMHILSSSSMTSC